MKRVAESQLTKDTVENEDEPQEVRLGIQKADPSVLGTREIRGLPKRNLATPTTPSGTPVPTSGTSNRTVEKSPVEPMSRFGGFAGFGVTGAASPFNFHMPSSQADKAPSQSTTAPSALFSASASLPSGPSSIFSNPSNPTPPSTPPLSSGAQNKQDAALAYYMALRGLNSSFLDAATKAVQADPFVDIIEMLEKYKSLRLATQIEFDGHSEPPRGTQAAKSAAPSVMPHDFSKVSPSTSTTPNPFGLGDKSGVTASLSTAGGFTPNVEPSLGAATSPFVWPSKPVPKEMQNNPFTLEASSKTFKPTETNDVVSGDFSSPFGKSNSKLANAPENRFPLFSAGQSSPDASDSKPAVASQSMFGNDKSPVKTDAPFFHSGSSSSAAPLTPGLSSFLGPSKTSGATADASTPPPIKFGIPNASPPSPSSFGFGSGKNLGTSSTFGSFGKGSIGNPVGFAFGSPPITPSVADTSATTATSGTKAIAETGEETDPVANHDSSSAPEHDPSPAPSQGSAFDADGRGEEDENTIHETKARAFKMVPNGDKGEKKWSPIGTGQMKLKAHKDLAKRRIVMRNSSTGNIILNFNLLPGFKITVDGKTFSFCVPGEDQSGTFYRLRVLTETDALSWQETVSREVDNLGPSGDT